MTTYYGSANYNPSLFNNDDMKSLLIGIIVILIFLGLILLGFIYG